MMSNDTPIDSKFNDPFDNFDEHVKQIKESVIGKQEVIDFSPLENAISAQTQELKTVFSNLESGDVEENRSSIVKRYTPSNIQQSISKSIGSVDPTLLDSSSDNFISDSVIEGSNNTKSSSGNQSESDNFLTNEKKIVANTEQLVTLFREQLKLSREQLKTLNVIKDELAPKTPVGLSDEKVQPYDILKDFEENDSGGSDGLDLTSLATGAAASKVLSGGGDKKEKSKKKKPKVSSSSKLAGNLAKGAGLAAAGVGAYLAYDNIKKNNENKENLLNEIESKVESGEISQEEGLNLLKEVEIESSNNNIDVISETGGALAGGLAGAKLGAMVGSMLGPAGAVVGGVAGGVMGSVMGSNLGKELGEKFKDSSSTVSNFADEAGNVVDIVKDKAGSIFDDVKSFFTSDKVSAEVANGNPLQSENITINENEESEFMKSVKNDLDSKRKSAIMENEESEFMKSVKNDLDSKRKSAILADKESVISVNGVKPTQYINDTAKEISNMEKADSSNSNQGGGNITNNMISNNNSVSNVPKPTPRSNDSMSALERYINKITSL
jgi:hypothetical protein